MRLVFFLSTSLLVWAQQTSFPIETEDNQPRPVYDVVVVGVGLTGLAFARKFKQLQPNATVVLLEARGQVGGRVRARSMATSRGDDWLDLGSQFVSRDHRDLQRVAAELGVKLVPQSSCGERTLVLEGVRRSRREVSWSPGLSVRPSFGEILESPDAPVLARQSVADFVKTIPSADAAATNRLLQTLFDAPEQKVSALHVALAAASDNATVTELLLNTGHGQSLIFEKGVYNFVRTMADGLNIEYNQRVIGVNRQSSPAVVMTSSSSFLARQVVVALPPAVAATVVFSPPLEQDFQSFLEQYKPQGDAFYFTISFPSAFWRAKQKSGQIIHTAAKGPLAWLTTFDVTTDTHCVSAAGTTGILWGIAHFVKGVAEKDRLAAYHTIVKKALGTDQDPLDIKDMQLSSDPLALGSFGVLPPGVSLNWLDYLTGATRQGQSTIFASAEFSNISIGLMNGAIVSGERAADMIEPVQSPGTPIGSTGFVYSTSTFYPPADNNVRVVLGSALARDPSQSGFQYSTSTHYPVMENSVKEDAEVQQYQPQSQFVYETSSFYPPTAQPPATTTYKHFSFGNLKEEEAPANMLTGQPNNKEGFAYQTSTQYPPTEKPPATTTMRHFSFGNLNEKEEEPANMVVASERQGIFEYHTSTQYPAIDRPPVVSTFNHFSFGNIGQPGAQPEAAVDSYAGGAANSVQMRSDSSVSPTILAELQQVTQQAPSTDSLALARSLSGIVQHLLENLKKK